MGSAGKDRRLCRRRRWGYDSTRLAKASTTRERRPSPISLHHARHLAIHAKRADARERQRMHLTSLQSIVPARGSAALWNDIRSHAQDLVMSEPILSQTLRETILRHVTLEAALCF